MLEGQSGYTDLRSVVSLNEPPVHDHLEARAERYLSSLGITLWAKFILTDPDGLRDAAKWLTAQYRALNSEQWGAR